MPIPKPFNLTTWIEEHRDLLKPPVGNKNLYVDSGDYIRISNPLDNQLSTLPIW